MKKKINKRISFIGAGRVATAFAKAYFKAGYNIHEICSLHFNHSENLAKKVKAKPVRKIPEMTEADIFIIAVKDDEVKNLSAYIKFKKAIVIHTSGTVELDVLKNKFENCGVIYPLQSFSGEEVDLSATPVLLESYGSIAEKKIPLLAKVLSKKLYTANTLQRQKIHLAAVLVANFTNYMYSEAYEILNKEKIPFSILFPLIENSNKKILKKSPKEIQTGPALRKDVKTMAKHSELLKDNKQLQKIYKEISLAIQEMHSPKKQK